MTVIKVENGQLEYVICETPIRSRDIWSLLRGSFEAILYADSPTDDGQIVLYARDDQLDAPLAPNCIVDGIGPIAGPLIIVGLDGDRNRSLSSREQEAIRLDPAKDEDGLPTLMLGAAI